MALSLEGLHEEFALDAIPKHLENYELAKIPCCWLLKDTEQEKTVKLNETSLLIWKMCTGEFTVGDMIGALEESFPDTDTIAKDVHRALDMLNEEEVIRFL